MVVTAIAAVTLERTKAVNKKIFDNSMGQNIQNADAIETTKSKAAIETAIFVAGKYTPLDRPQNCALVILGYFNPL